MCRNNIDNTGTKRIGHTVRLKIIHWLKEWWIIILLIIMIIIVLTANAFLDPEVMRKLVA